MARPNLLIARVMGNVVAPLVDVSKCVDAFAAGSTSPAAWPSAPRRRRSSLPCRRRNRRATRSSCTTSARGRSSATSRGGRASARV